MKNKFLTIIYTVLCISCLAGCGAKEPETVTITNPIEISSSTADMSGYKWMDSGDTAFQLITLKESIRFFSEKGSGILYYGRTNCPWCQRAVPELAKVATDYGVTVYYVDVDSSIPVADEDYEELVSYIESTFQIDPETREPSFYVPEVIGVKNGEVTGSHISLVDSFKITSEDAQMSSDQKSELDEVYANIIKAAAD